MNLKTAMLEALAQEWEANARMNRVVELAWSMAGKKPADDVRKYTDLAAAVRARRTPTPRFTACPSTGSRKAAQVAQALGRQWIGCELNTEYAPLQQARTAQAALAI